MQISEHVYQVLGPMYANLANVYVIRGENSLIMIDTAEDERDMAVIRMNLKRFQLDRLPISHVILTHKHFGHIGNAAFLQKNGSKILCGYGDAQAIMSGSLNEIMDFSPFPEREYTPCSIDQTVTDGQVLFLDGIELTFHEVKGHTNGSILIEMREGDERVLFVGDVLSITNDCRDVQLGWEGAVDFNVEDNFRSILKMAELDCDILLPGHQQICMQNGRYLLKKAINTALLKYRKPSVDRE